MEFTGYRALIVDDEPYVRELTMRALERRALQCDCASDGDEAMVLASRYSYDAVITDLRMPRRHGHSLATNLLSWPDRPKVIVLTGLAEPRLIQDLKSRGIDDLIHKPVDFNELASRVLSLIDPAYGIDLGGESEKSGQILATIETTLLELSDMFADRLDGVFELGDAVVDPPTAVNDYILRLEEEEAAAEEKAANPGVKEQNSRRRHERVRVKAVALAVPVTRHFVRAGDPFALAVRDISESGVRLLHTRASSSEYLAIKWSCHTKPFRDVEVVAKLMRCSPLSRFYDYGCQFVLAD